MTLLNMAKRNSVNDPRALPDSEVRFGSLALLMTDWIDTTNFVCVGGRGVAKSTVIIARRSERCVRLMPGAPVAIVANTYSNLVDNIMPAVQNGWRLQGLIEGVHYVKGRRPPGEWSRRCSVIIDDYRHVYSFWNGSVIMLGSLDNASLLAGKSVAHLIFDEAKFASDVKAARVMPILRGDAITYGHCHLFMGVTITTDMPDVTSGEYDWFFRYASEMEPDRIITIVQAASELNRLRIKQLRLGRQPEPQAASRLPRLEKRIAYYENALLKLRKGQTFFTNISSLVNIDILTLDYIDRLYNGGLELHEFLKSVLGMRPGVRKDARFYSLFSDSHKYYDGTLSGVAAFSSSELQHLDPTRPLEGGMDFGNMLSLVIGQRDGRVCRVHKNLYVIAPEWMRELADDFLRFFAPHQCKVLELFYDRSGNSYSRQGVDYAAQIKEAIEKDASGRHTGWSVRLMSRNQADIPQNAEYNFMHTLMEENTEGLPLLRVDALNCPELISSLELARTKISYRGDRKIVKKDKSSEKLPVAKLPRLSTNFSDAFKYLMMRREWRLAARPDQADGSGASASAARWLASHGKPGSR